MAGSLYLCDADDALALFDHGARIDIGTRLLLDRHGFTGHGSLIHRHLALDHGSVERDYVRSANHYTVAHLYVLHIDQNIGAFGLHPDLLDLEAHGTRQVADRFLMRPLLEYLTDLQEEHDRGSRAEVGAEHRSRNGRRIENRDFQAARQEAAHTVGHIAQALNRCPSRTKRCRQEEHSRAVKHYLPKEFLLVVAIHRTAAVFGDQRECVFIPV